MEVHSTVTITRHVAILPLFVYRIGGVMVSAALRRKSK